MIALIRYLRFHWTALVSIGLRGGGVLLGFAVTWFIGNQMGPVANGHYALITQTAMFLSVAAAGGIDLAMVRDFSAATVHNLQPARQSFVRVCLLSLALVLAIMAIVVAAGPYIKDELTGTGAPAAALLLMGVMFFARTITRVTSAFLRSQRAYVLGQTVEVIIIPAIVVVAILLQWAPSLDAVLYWTAAAGIAASALGIATSLRLTSAETTAHRVPMRGLVKAAVPLWGVAVSRTLGEWYGLAVVAALLSVYDAGLFRVAVQIGSALAIISVGILSIFSPQIGAAYARRDYAEIARLTRSSSLLSTVIVLPLVIGILIFAEPLLGFIGPEFRAGTLLVQIIVLGQALFVCTGTSGITLAMTGHEKVNLALTVGSLVILGVSVPLAAIYGGLIWVGVAVTAVLVGRNIGAIVAVRMFLGIGMLTGRYHPMPDHAAPNRPAPGV